jgi:putative endonuclease
MATKKQRHEQKGRWAEVYAAFYLQMKGYRILTRRFKTALGEVDIIATKRNILIGIEVKAHKTFDAGMWAITPTQQKRIIRGLKIFLAIKPKWTSADIRFDIILVKFPYIRHLKHVWSEST